MITSNSNTYTIPIKLSSRVWWEAATNSPHQTVKERNDEETDLFFMVQKKVCHSSV